MIVQELESKLQSLTPVERFEAICILTKNIGTNIRGIVKTPGVIGGDACIAGTRIPIWLLASYRQEGATDANILNAYPQLSAVELVTAWLYVEAFYDEINTAIQEQEGADIILDSH